jgi:hypothetical protein
MKFTSSDVVALIVEDGALCVLVLWCLFGGAKEGLGYWFWNFLCVLNWKGMRT